jgi:hypothetical protein
MPHADAFNKAINVAVSIYRHRVPKINFIDCLSA